MMAAASPALNNNNTNSAMAAAPKPTTLAAAVNLGNRTDTPPKSQRGQNKPKCKQCGNVARSRCPYEQCKSCCSRNQNPCHIHVLKGNSTFQDKTQSFGAAPLDQQSSEPSSLTSSSRVASLRQLSNSFAQFNNLHISLRSKKPLSRKDAAAINEWRFSKLKEYKERNTEVENEAFDRYMQNVELLEEVLSTNSMDDDQSSALESDSTSLESNGEMMIPGLKLQLRSNSRRSESVRMRIRQIVNDGLKKLQESAFDGDIKEPCDDEEDSNKTSKRAKSWRAEKLLAFSDLIDKLNKARNEEDLRSCMEIKSKLFNLDQSSKDIEVDDTETHENWTAACDSIPVKPLDYSFPKLVGTTEIDQATLDTIDKHFSTLEHVEEL